MHIPFQTKPDKYIVYGDMGADDSIPTYALLERLINTDEYTAILHVGDLGYDLHSDYGKVQNFKFISYKYKPVRDFRNDCIVEQQRSGPGHVTILYCGIVLKNTYHMTAGTQLK